MLNSKRPEDDPPVLLHEFVSTFEVKMNSQPDKGRARNSEPLQRSSSSSLLLSGLELSDTKVYDPEIQAPLETAAYLCTVGVLRLRTVPN